jgi:ABC-type amino acid transport substrate-binding protein
MLQKGEIDINYADALIWNSPEEQHHYVFSKSYSTVNEHLYFLADHPGADQTIKQIDHLTVGTVRGYTYWALDPAFARNRLTRLETSQDDALLKLLQSGRVDAVAMVDDIFDALVASSHLNPNLFRQGAKLSEAPLVFKLQPQLAQWLPRINRAIDTLRSSGELERIRGRYLQVPKQASR